MRLAPLPAGDIYATQQLLGHADVPIEKSP